MQREANPAQRIIGWLALVLQGERGPLGRSVQYKHTSPDVILLQWAGGPTARETAQRLHSAADPELPITEITYPSPDRARLRVAGVTVCLQACDPEPGARPLSVDDDHPGQAETNVLRWRGVAFHGVLWRLQPEQEADGVIIERSVERETRWPALPVSRHMVALANPTFPDWAGKRHTAWSFYRHSTSIVLWDATDLDVNERVLEAELRHGYAACAGIMRRRELILRTHTEWGSWHMHAHTEDLGVRSDMVAAALADAALHTGQPPQQLRLAHIGDAYSRSCWRIEAERAVPIS